MKLKQRRLFSTKEFEINENNLYFKFKSIGNYLEHNISYEDIGTELVRKKEAKRGWLYAAIICFIFGTIFISDYLTANDSEALGTMLFYFPASLVTFAIYYFSATRYVYLISDETSLEFFDSKPNVQEFNNFLETLLEKRKIYLKNKYAKIDNSLPHDRQLGIFNWLRNQEIISENEHDHLINELSGNTTKPVGF